MTTFQANADAVERKWHLIDLEGKTLGRIATEIARLLRGKHKPIYTPHADTGDFVVAINADKIKVTGNKVDGKMYYHHTGHPGGIKEKTFSKLHDQYPTRIIEAAVRGMLPKNALGRDMFRKFKVYEGAEHPHAAQQPIIFEGK